MLNNINTADDHYHQMAGEMEEEEDNDQSMAVDINNKSKYSFIIGHSAMSDLMQTKRKHRPHYWQYRVNPELYNTIEQSSELLCLTKTNAMNKYIYKTPKDRDFERINVETGESLIIRDKKNTQELFMGANVGTGFDQTICDQWVYYFDQNYYFRISIDPYESSEWIQGQCQLNPHAGSYSTIYDGDSTVYISGGFTIEGDLSDIYSFDLKSLKSKKIGQLLQPLTLHSMALGANPSIIYMIGGFNNLQNVNKIDQFNLQTGQSETVVTLDKPLVNGIFNRHNSCFYMVTDTQPIGFLRYSLKTQSSTTLQSPPPIENPNNALISIFKLFFDQINTISFIYPTPPYQNSLFRYNIETDQWTTTNVKIINP
ncbi:RING zinc finger-containing protein [Tieghemostelium lacteum]|uniref:RING zinc finger-containing protein n=1 Tax=Tieghemostelium lacteum TaxID=361077 RepID=A0A152A891_TIELA|nr:RING zinc finger-containing protein [Tieghemostelium lacteum]|eukprot:KYR02453.1 RING zinc finger-containing protein [Tieghemostelium lacteum]